MSESIDHKFRAEVLREGAAAIVAKNDQALWATKPGKHWAADLLNRMAETADAVAEQGALPMPVGPVPQGLGAERLAGIEALAEAATDGPWCTDAWEIYQGAEYVPGISFWIGETCRGTADLEQDRADAAFVAAARSDVPELVAEVRRQTARIAELEAERHSTNEALSDAAEALRADRGPTPQESADRLTRFFAPTQALREDEAVEPWLGCIRCRGEEARKYLKDGGLRGGCPACGLDNDGGCANCRHRHTVGEACGTAIATGGVYARRCQCTGPKAGA